MALFSIDDKKCKKDGFCAYECPKGIIDFTDKKNCPKPTEDAESRCINCGHCVAVCPHEAFIHKNLKPGECIPILENNKLSTEQVIQFFKSRRSIRNFKSKPVENEKLEQLLDIARYAPTGHNSQPVKWLIQGNPAKIKGIAEQTVNWMKFMIKEQKEMASALSLDLIVEKWGEGIDTICREAPHIFLAYGESGNPMAPAACTIALTHLELAAPALDLGACWAGYVHAAALYWPDMKTFLGIEDGTTVHGAMMIGYPRYKYHRIPSRNNTNARWE